VTFRVPWMRHIDPSAWDVQTSHFAERFQLFIILALGESIVITGATTSELALGTERVLAFALAFAVTAALWWLYFSYAARVAERRLELAPNRTTLARDAYTYLHVVMAAGVIVSAVGDELVIAHPGEHLHTAELLAVAGGPALYLLALTLFRLRMAGTVAWKRLGAAAACLVAAPLGSAAPALVLGSVVFAILVAVIVAEERAGARRASRGELSPLERLNAEAESSAARA
jgi:low temperature requirement protein LtrA